MQLAYKNSLLTRWIARLVELARIPGQLRDLLIELQRAENKPAQHPARFGIAQVEAARGKLIHRVVIKQQQVTEYQILAPTEWNFHPQGLIQQSLSQLKAKNNEELRLLSRLIINAIDPCVGYDLRIH